MVVLVDGEQVILKLLVEVFLLRELGLGGTEGLLEVGGEESEILVGDLCAIQKDETISLKCAVVQEDTGTLQA